MSITRISRRLQFVSK